MSQPSSSIISADSAQIKYKKALKEISKLISANRTLRQSNQKATREFKDKIDYLSLTYQHLQKQYKRVSKQKQDFNHYLDQIQKQRNNLEREVAYLNDVLAEQNGELKKLNMHKDDRSVATLIRTYQDKQATMNRTRAQNQDMISKLKSTVQRLQSELQYQRNLKQDAQEKYKNLNLQINSYKQQNSSLISQIDRLLKESSQKDTYCVQKQKQLRMLIRQLQKQIHLLKTVQDQSQRVSKNNQNQGYQQLLSEKNKLVIELTKTQNAYQEVMLREKQFYEMQERMKTAKLQSQRLTQEVNMLKSKIVVLQSKQFLTEAGDDDYAQKQFEQRINMALNQQDPLLSIKNYDDNSHFRILKSFIVDLQDKIYKLNSQKKQISKKYKSIKTKFTKNTEQLLQYEEQNRLLRGKLQGFQRLTQKLQFQFQRALTNHQQQVARITITSNNLITKKVQEYKTTINFLNSQLEMSQDKSDRMQKNFKQQIQTLRLQLETLNMKNRDQTDKSNKDNELIQFFKKKNSQLSSRINILQEQLSNSSENMTKFQHLFKQQKGKNQGLLSQKQQLLAQIRQLSQQIDKKSSSFNNNYKIKQDQYEFQIRKMRSQNQKLKDQLQYSVKECKNSQRDIEQIRRNDQSEVEQIKRLTQRNVQLESKSSQFKRRIRDLEDENETLKIKSKKFQESYEKTAKYQEQNISKNDKINDLTRAKLQLQSDFKNLQNKVNDQLKQAQQMRKQLSNLKMKNLQVSHQSKKQFQIKLLESKKNIQSLNQDISDLSTELRDQKSKNLRMANQLNTIKAQKNRLQQIFQQNRKKDIQNEGQVSNLKIELSNGQMQIQRLHSQVKNQKSLSNNLNIQIENLQQKIFLLNQELSNLKMKLQSSQDLKSDLIKDLTSFKFNFNSIQAQVNQAKFNLSLQWQQQNFYNNISDILSKIRRICNNYGVPIQSASGTYSPAQPRLNSSSSQKFIQISSLDPKLKGNNAYSSIKSYKDQDQLFSGRDLTPRIETGNNFQANLGTTQSIGSTKFDLNYSSINYGRTQSIFNNLSDNQSWNNKPTYEYSSPKNSNYEFNFSSLIRGNQV